MPEDCLFCRIVAGSIPAARVHEDADILAFRDIHPQARIHLLVIPKAHVESVLDLPPGSPVMSRLVETACALARREGLAEGGFRLVVNTGSDGGQTVPHLHLHLMGGRRMTWPP
jgi:histidine triad (HIT) family protein